MKPAISIETIGATVVVSVPANESRDVYRLARRLERELSHQVVAVKVFNAEFADRTVVVFCNSLALARYARADVDRLVACEPEPMAVVR